MALKIRLSRRGRKKLALYDIVVADARAPRDGRFIEKLGSYNPNTHPATVSLKEEDALQWLFKGAQPTNTVKTILSSHGILFKKHLQIGVNKGAVTQEAADKKFADWKQAKENKLAKKPTQVAKESKAHTAPKQQAAASVAKKDAIPNPEAAAEASATLEKVAQIVEEQSATEVIENKEATPQPEAAAEASATVKKVAQIDEQQATTEVIKKKSKK
jgi:small subunit ribosomal protein S16